MERKEKVRQTIEKFITSNHDQRLSQCSFGIEIETQSEGHGDDNDDWQTVYNNLGYDDYMDTDTLNEDLSAETERHISDSYLSDLLPRRWASFAVELPAYRVTTRRGSNKFLPIYASDLRELQLSMLIKRLRKIERRLDDAKDNDVKVKLFNKYCTMYDPITDIEELDEQLDYHISEVVRDDFDDSEYRLDIDDIRAAHPELFSSDLKCDSDLVEIVDDQSISGQELRTIGGLNHDKFTQAAESICNAIDKSEHYVDGDCSAHIHIQVGDITHYYGNGVLHGAIMEYLVLNKDKLPKTVQRRLKDGGNRWIKPAFHDNKYTWVNFHDQGTIEFRLFGYIDELDDILACQKIALDALAYAYQVRLGDYERKYSNDELSYLARSA